MTFYWRRGPKVQKATESIGEEVNGCGASESDHENQWFPTALLAPLTTLVFLPFPQKLLQ